MHLSLATDESQPQLIRAAANDGFYARLTRIPWTLMSLFPVSTPCRSVALTKPIKMIIMI